MIDPGAAARSIEEALRVVATPERAVNEKRYLKSDLDFLGAKVPETRAAVRDFAKANPALSREQTLAVAEALWARPVHELRGAAIDLLALKRTGLQAEDIALVERFLREAKTWALVDGLAPNVAGYLFERYPELEPVRARWATDPDFWMKRSTLLSFFEPLRRNPDAAFPAFAAYADPMLQEREFFIRKAIGWVLRDVSKKRPDLVAGWLLPRASRASPLTIREGSKYLSPEHRDSLLTGLARAPAQDSAVVRRFVARVETGAASMILRLPHGVVCGAHIALQENSMLGDKIGESRGTVKGQRVVRGDDYRYMKFEVSIEESGTLYGAQAQNMATYTSYERVPGQIYGEGQGIFGTNDGEGAIWNGHGIGSMDAQGNQKFLFSVACQAGPTGKLSALNTVLVVGEHEVDVEGNTHTTFWEWK